MAAINIMDIEAVQNLFELVIDPILQLLFALAVFYFIYGVFKFVQDKAAGASDDIKQGANHVLYGTIGIFIMGSVLGIIHLLQNTIGAN
jgi:hypothetical protein